ncbi:MAG: hypothetical protein Q8N51_00945 [Gammaproteobacteria bacterium]|nr:hypothetical protein [Gammaproteobacteria bacterium]
MQAYISNVVAWLSGFTRLKSVAYKPGWSHLKFLPVYLFDYGFCVLVLAGPVTSVSYYVHNKWFSLGYHGAHAGPPLWGTVRSPPYVRVAVPALWLLISVIAYLY